MNFIMSIICGVLLGQTGAAGIRGILALGAGGWVALGDWVMGVNSHHGFLHMGGGLSIVSFGNMSLTNLWAFWWGSECSSDGFRATIGMCLASGYSVDFLNQRIMGVSLAGVLLCLQFQHVREWHSKWPCLRPLRGATDNQLWGWQGLGLLCLWLPAFNCYCDLWGLCYSYQSGVSVQRSRHLILCLVVFTA